MDVETLYNSFFEEFVSPWIDTIDFVGINLSSTDRQQLLFKTYRHKGTTIENKDAFLNYLEEREMIKNYLPIRTSEDGRVQYDVRIANRTETNISELILFIQENLVPKGTFSSTFFQAIRYFAEMRISDDSRYCLASLYFFGMMWKYGELRALKTHFLTRKTVDPDHFSNGYHYDDEYYLGYIRRCDIPNVAKLYDLVADALTCMGGHLWMIGADAYYGFKEKYKVYLQNPKGYDIKTLNSIVGRHDEMIGLSNLISEISFWLSSHKELVLYGIAFTVTSHGEYGVNLYVIP